MRRFTDKDISDFKMIIQLMVYYIDAEELAKRASLEMQKKGK